MKAFKQDMQDSSIFLYSGICECAHGFEGDDCSVDREKGPKVFGLIAESFCDSSKRPCSFISVFGNGFYETEIVKCRIKEAHVHIIAYLFRFFSIFFSVVFKCISVMFSLL